MPAACAGRPFLRQCESPWRALGPCGSRGGPWEGHAYPFLSRLFCVAFTSPFSLVCAPDRPSRGLDTKPPALLTWRHWLRLNVRGSLDPQSRTQDPDGAGGERRGRWRDEHTRITRARVPARCGLASSSRNSCFSNKFPIRASSCPWPLVACRPSFPERSLNGAVLGVLRGWLPRQCNCSPGSPTRPGRRGSPHGRSVAGCTLTTRRLCGFRPGAVSGEATVNFTCTCFPVSWVNTSKRNFWLVQKKCVSLDELPKCHPRWLWSLGPLFKFKMTGWGFDPRRWTMPRVLSQDTSLCCPQPLSCPIVDTRGNAIWPDCIAGPTLSLFGALCK